MTRVEMKELKDIIESIARKQKVDIQKEELSERERTDFVKGLEDWLNKNR